jgi:hypothetical protein
MNFDKLIEIIVEKNSNYKLLDKKLLVNNWDKHDDPRVEFKLEIDGIYHECYFPLDYSDKSYNTIKVEKKKWPFGLWKKDEKTKHATLVGSTITPSEDKEQMKLRIARSAKLDKKYKVIMAELLDMAFQMMEDHNREQMTNGNKEVYDVFKDTFDEI